MKHCCTAMARWADSQCERHPDRFDCPDALIHRAPSSGKYGLIIHDGGSSTIAIEHCPWCGRKLSELSARKPPFPVPQASRAIELDWAPRLAERFGVDVEEFRSQPTRHFSYPLEGVRVVLMDESEVRFKYAFALHWEEKRALAVFTEHCGHHVFPDHEAVVSSGGFGSTDA